MHLAAKKGRVSVVKYLLENGADLQLMDDHRDQPVHLASSEGHVKCVQSIRKIQPPSLLNNVYSRVVEACIKKNPDCVHWKGHKSLTPLHKVCQSSGDPQTAKCLLDAEADVNAK